MEGDRGRAEDAAVKDMCGRWQEWHWAENCINIKIVTHIIDRQRNQIHLSSF